MQDENWSIPQAKSMNSKKSFVYKVKTNRKALTTLSTSQMIPRPNAPVHSSKALTKRSASLILKNSAQKVDDDDLDDLDFDQLSIGGKILPTKFYNYILLAHNAGVCTA